MPATGGASSISTKMPSRFPAAAALALLLPFTLSGCTVSVFVHGDTSSIAQQPLTTAGRYYLDSICPRNAATYAYDAVRTSSDLTALHRVAAAASTASAKAAAALRAPGAPWPSSLRPRIDLLARSLDLDVRSYTQLAGAPTLQAARAVEWPGNTSAGNARLIIRKAIGLSDRSRTDDCVGHYDGQGSTDATVTS